MLNAVVNIFIPIAILLTMSSEERLGPIPAVLLAVGIPVVYGTAKLIRTRKMNASSTLGIISVLMTGVIAVFRLDTALFPVKEAIIPVGFAAVLLVSNKTAFPIVRLMFDMVQRTDRVRAGLDTPERKAAYRAHVERHGALWAGIMTLSGVMKFLLASVIMTAEAGTEQFNTQLATYELMQIPTSMLVTMVLILSLIWSIGKGTGRIIGLTPSEVLRGGERIAALAGRFSRTKAQSA